MQPEDAADFGRTLKLGKELAAALPGNDTLGRWMAHYIGELIIRAKSATGDQVQSIQRETAETIIGLWRHRADFPGRNRPLAAFDPVLAALERLSEPQRPWRFYATFEDGNEPDSSELSHLPLLRCALELEDTVRDVVRQIIIAAAADALDREAKWVKLASYLPDDNATMSINALFKLMDEYRGDSEPFAPDTTPAASEGEKFVNTLRQAESKIRRVRLELEKELVRRRSAGGDEPAY